MKIFSGLARNAIMIGIASGFLTIAGYLLMWALWYAIAPHPYHLYVVNARALQEGLFMLLIVPAVTAIFVLATNVCFVRTAGDAIVSAVISGMVSGATVLIASVAGLFTLFFSLVPGPFQCDSVLFCSATGYDSMINDPLPLYYFGPHGDMLTPLQGALSVFFDVLMVAIRSMLVPAFLTMVFALAIFYLLPGLYRIFENNDKHNLEKALVTLAIGLVIFTVIIIPPIAFVCL